MSKIILQGFIIIPKQDRELILAELQHHSMLTLAEDGCIKFEIKPAIASDDNGKYWVYEEFVSIEAFEYHQARVKSSKWGKISKEVERHYDPIIEVKEDNILVIG